MLFELSLIWDVVELFLFRRCDRKNLSGHSLIFLNVFQTNNESNVFVPTQLQKEKLEIPNMSQIKDNSKGFPYFLKFHYS